MFEVVLFVIVEELDLDEGSNDVVVRVKVMIKFLFSV